MTAHRMKRLLIVSDALLPWHNGGKERRYAILAKQIPNNEWNVQFATMKWWTNDTNCRMIAVTKKRDMYTTKGNRSISQAIHFALGCFRLLTADFDVMECDQIPILQIFSLYVVCKLKKKKLTTTFHEHWSSEQWRQELGFIFGFVANIAQRVSIQLPDHIFAASQHTYSSLARTGIDIRKLSLAEVTIDHTPRENRPGGHGLIQHDLLYVGRLAAHKNVDQVLIGFKKVLESRPSLTLGIIGDGPARDELKAIALRTLPSGSYAFYTDVHDHAIVLDAMKSANVFCTLSGREGYGIAAAEALNCGTYVVMLDAINNAATDFINKFPRQIGLVKEDFSNFPEKVAEGLRYEKQGEVFLVETSTNEFQREYTLVWNELINGS